MASSGTSTPSGKPQILVAEDDDALRRMMGHMLGDFAEVFLAPDGMEALMFLRRAERVPDLLVTDLMMPRLDGLALAKRLKDDARFGGMPVIILTAKGGATDVVAGINAGARHYLTKPFKRDDLLAKVKKVLGVS